jgi:hypothetical protein
LYMYLRRVVRSVLPVHHMCVQGFHQKNSNDAFIHVQLLSIVRAVSTIRLKPLCSFCALHSDIAPHKYNHLQANSRWYGGERQF